MTSSSVAKTSRRLAPPTVRAHPDEERIGQRYDARRRRRALFFRRLFFILVVAPTAVAALYYGLWAAPRYVSETQLIVRTVEGTQSADANSVFNGIMNSFGIMRSDDDSNAVLAYLQSRDAVKDLETALPLRKMYGREEADAPARFPRPFFGDSFERLYWYYGDRVTSWIEPDSGIITVEAQAFRPDDAQAIARQLLSQAEALVNEMNERMEADTVRAAEVAVADAQKVVVATQEDVDRFRSAEIVVDPTQNAVAQLQTITQLSGQVDQVLAQILANNKLSPSNPATIALKAQADALSAQIDKEEKALAGSKGAVASKVSTYERLTLLRTLADASLSAARQSLATARTDARRQHVFVEEIVSPNLPDYALEPERLRSIATVFALSLAAFAILWMVSTGIKEMSH